MTTRRWLTFIEIDVSICSLSYGVAPCTASVPTTGVQKCFNTRGSCQDLANYADSTVTLRFAKDTPALAESGIEAIPSLVGVDLTPTEVSLGENLGRRASLNISFKDHSHSDTGAGFDKYLSTRTYDPYSQGTFWGKFAARHPNLRGKKLRLIQGYLGQSLDDMETRHFTIDSVEGPALDGRFTITAKDPLKALDAERAMAPAVSPGYLSVGINSSTTSASLAPAGVGNASYPVSGYVKIGKEVASFTRVGDALTITRGQKNTTADSHSAGDNVQVCLSYSAQKPTAIIQDLMVTYGGVDSSYITLADWTTETDAYNGQVYTGFITDPMPVKTLISEVIEVAGLAVWWDEVLETIRLQVLRAIATDTATYDESQIIAGSLQITSQPEKRLSQVWTYFGQTNPVDGIALSNLPGIAALEDTDSETNYGVAIKTIATRWIATGGRTIADKLNSIQLGRYLAPPRKVAFSLTDTEGTIIPEVGGGYRLSVPNSQDVDGARIDLAFTVTGIRRLDGRIDVTGEELNWTTVTATDPLSRQISIDYAVRNANMRSLHNALYGTPVSGGTVTLTISSTGRIGSNSTSSPALDTGTWPSTSFTGTRTSGNATITSIADTSAFVAGQAVTGSGVRDGSRVLSKTVNSVTLDKTLTANGSASLTLWTTIVKIVNNGRIAGRGGTGGKGKGGDNNTGGTGGDGGDGLKVRAPIDLSGTGRVDGGGGGGGGAGGDYVGLFGPQQNGGGGGGGAGDPGGSGGSSGGSGAHGGSAGSLNSGGNGGDSNYSTFHGGDGGDPGVDGNRATGTYYGVGGDAGNSVNGASLVKDTAFSGTYHGPQTG